MWVFTKKLKAILRKRPFIAQLGSGLSWQVRVLFGPWGKGGSL